MVRSSSCLLCGSLFYHQGELTYLAMELGLQSCLFMPKFPFCHPYIPYLVLYEADRAGLYNCSIC